MSIDLATSQHIAELLPEPVFVVSSDGVIVSANESAVEMLAISRE